MHIYTHLFNVTDDAQSHIQVQLFVTPRTIVCKATLSLEFSRQEYWSGLPFPHPGDFPNPGIKPVSTVSPALAGGFLTPSTTWQAQYHRKYVLITITPLLYPCVSKTIDLKKNSDHK